MTYYLIMFVDQVTKRRRFAISLATSDDHARRLAVARLSTPSWRGCHIKWVLPIEDIIQGKVKPYVLEG